MKYCMKCGHGIDDNSTFCPVCGSPQNEQDISDASEAGSQYNSGEQPYVQTTNFNVQDRNIGIAILLSFITCGIYSLYWLAMMNDDLNRETQDYVAPSGGIVVLLSIVTCGIYELYWLYKAGEKVAIIKRQRYEIGGGNENIIYLVLGIVGLGIVSYALIQSEINTHNKM